MKKKPTEKELAALAFRRACLDLEIAKAAFDQAEPEFFEVANTELTIAQMKVDNCRKRAMLLTV